MIYLDGGESRIRTYEGYYQRIYSPSPLAARESRQFLFRIAIFTVYCKFYIRKGAQGMASQPSMLYRNFLRSSP